MRLNLLASTQVGMICTGMHCWHRFQPMLTPHAGKINCNSFSLRPSTRFTTIPAALNLMRKDCSSYVCIQELLGRGAGASKKGDGAAMVISFLQKDVAAAKARMLVLQTGVHARIFKELNSLIFPLPNMGHYVPAHMRRFVPRERVVGMNKASVSSVTAGVQACM